MHSSTDKILSKPKTKWFWPCFLGLYVILLIHLYSCPAGGVLQPACLKKNYVPHFRWIYVPVFTLFSIPGLLFSIPENMPDWSLLMVVSVRLLYISTSYISVCLTTVCVLVCSSGAVNAADWSALLARERRPHYSSVNSNTECESTAAVALCLKDLSNWHSAGNLQVSGRIAFVIAVLKRLSMYDVIRSSSLSLCSVTV